MVGLSVATFSPVTNIQSVRSIAARRLRKQSSSDSSDSSSSRRGATVRIKLTGLKEETQAENSSSTSKKVSVTSNETRWQTIGSDTTTIVKSPQMSHPKPVLSLPKYEGLKSASKRTKSTLPPTRKDLPPARASSPPRRRSSNRLSHSEYDSYRPHSSSSRSNTSSSRLIDSYRPGSNRNYRPREDADTYRPDYTSRSSDNSGSMGSSNGKRRRDDDDDEERESGLKRARRDSKGLNYD